MANPSASTRQLRLIGMNVYHISQTIFVNRFTRDHESQDFRVFVIVRLKALPRLDQVFIQNKERVEFLKAAVPILREAKTMISFQMHYMK